MICKTKVEHNLKVICTLRRARVTVRACTRSRRTLTRLLSVFSSIMVAWSLRKRTPIDRYVVEDDGPRRKKQKVSAAATTKTTTKTTKTKTKASASVKANPRASSSSKKSPSAIAETTKRKLAKLSGTSSSSTKGPRTTAKTSIKTTKKSTKKTNNTKNNDVELPDEVWIAICELVCEAVDDDKLVGTNRKGEEVDKRKAVYTRRLETLFAIRGTNKQLCRLMSSDVGEEMFQRAFENLCEVSDATFGVDDAPPAMLWRHKAFFLSGLGCQACENHPTTRKPNWKFGVRMCKDCLLKRTVIDRELNDIEWTQNGTFEELTSGLPHDTVQGWSQFYKEAYTMVRYWKKSVKKRAALLRRAKTPSERAAICAPAPPVAKPDTQLLGKKACEQRKQALKAELDLIGCELRDDSKLCELFINGFPKSLRERKKWTAKKVAQRMAQMKYLHEYSREFRDFIQGWREEIDEMFNSFGPGPYRNYTYEVTGFHSFGAAVRDLADGWTNFPREWPWLARRHEDAA